MSSKPNFLPYTHPTVQDLYLTHRPTLQCCRLAHANDSDSAVLPTLHMLLLYITVTII